MAKKNKRSGLVGGFVGATAGGVAGRKIDKFRKITSDTRRDWSRMAAEMPVRFYQQSERAARTAARQKIFANMMAGNDMSGYEYRRTPEFNALMGKAKKRLHNAKGYRSVKPIATITGVVGGGLLGAFIDKKAEDKSMVKKADAVMQKLAAGGFAKILSAVIKRMPALSGKLGTTVQKASKIKTLRQLDRMDKIMDTRKITNRKALEFPSHRGGGGFDKLLARGAAMDDARLSQNAIAKARGAINSKWDVDGAHLLNKELSNYTKMQDYFKGVHKKSKPYKTLEINGQLVDKLKRMPVERMPLNITDNIIDHPY